MSVNDVIASVLAQLEAAAPSVLWMAYSSDIPNKDEAILPFGFVQEMPGVLNDTLPIAADYFPTRHTLGVTILVARGEFYYPSPEDAAVKASIIPIRDAVKTALMATPQFSGAVRIVGTDAAILSDVVGPVEYDTGRFMGVHFEMPFIT